MATSPHACARSAIMVLVLVFTTANGADPDGGSRSAKISDDGRYVVLESGATNLVENDTNGVNDIFVHDRESGETTRASVDDSGQEFFSRSSEPEISADGRFVVYRSYRNNTNNSDGVRVADILVFDRQTGETTLASVNNAGEVGNNRSQYPEISSDGRFVVFESHSYNLVDNDTNNTPDIFLHDRDTGETVRVSVSSSGEESNNPSFRPAVSTDGQVIVFSSNASNLVEGDTNGRADVFVHRRNTGETVRASVNSAGEQAVGPGFYGSSFGASISADGRLVAFVSSATNLVPGDTNGTEDVFVHDLSTGVTSRVSTSTQGAQGNNDSGGTSLETNLLGNDGRFVVFSSKASNLVANDQNGEMDIFVHDRQTVETTRVSLNSSGTEANDSSFSPAISSDGRFVTFLSHASNLVEGLDLNSTSDVFVRDREAGVTTRINALQPNLTPVTSWPGLRGGVTVDGNLVQFDGSRRGWWNSAYSSALWFFGFSGGEVRFEINGDPRGTTWVAGLGITESGPDWADIDYGFRSSDGRLEIRENGTWKSGGPELADGDVLAIEARTGGLFRITIIYKHNGNTIASTEFSPTWPRGFFVPFSRIPLYVDTAFRHGAISLQVSLVGQRPDLPEPGDIVSKWFNETGGVTTSENRIHFNGMPAGWQNSVSSAALFGLGFTDFTMYDGNDDKPISDDFEVLFTLDSDPSGTTWAVGVGTDETSQNPRDIEFAMRSSNGVLEIRENGEWRIGGNKLAMGDILSILIDGSSTASGGQVVYKHNGVPMFWSSYTGSPTFYVDSAFRDGPISISTAVDGLFKLAREDNLRFLPIRQVSAWVSPVGGVRASDSQIGFDGNSDSWSNSINSESLSALGLVDDYEVRFSIDTDPQDTTWVVGLGTDETGAQPTDIEFGLRSSDGLLSVRENGQWRRDGARLALGDEISILVSNGTVDYRHNGVSIYRTQLNVPSDFYIDTAFRRGQIWLDVSVLTCQTPVCVTQ